MTLRRFRERGRGLLARIGLGGRRGRPSGEFSGGHQQRVAIARALKQRPEIIFSDSEIDHLDAQSRELVVGLLDGISRAGGVTVVFVSHDTRHDAVVSRIVYVLDDADHRQPKPPALPPESTFTQTPPEP